MCNPKTATKKYITQLELPVEMKPDKESAITVPKRRLAPTFKPYDNRQSFAIFDVEGMIPEHHVARVIDEMIESIPDEQLFAHYPGGGRSSYHPKMMLKLIIYAYTQKEYSCRRIEKMTRENLPAIWLCAMQNPDYRTINEFRGIRMKSIIDGLFESVILQLHGMGLIEFEHYFVDGTKIEADANKYSFVWKKSTIRYEKQLKEKIRETLQEIHEIAEAEGLELGDMSTEEVTTEELAILADQLDEQVEVLTEMIDEETETPIRKELRRRRSILKKPVKLIRENFIPRKVKYTLQMETFGDRNSYSKTDPDATFMRMKEDHMKNGQLKPGYNVQMATENQFILFYSIHQNPTDTRCLIPHLDKLQSSSLPMPKTVVADAGYGSEENYLYLMGDEKEPLAEFLIPYSTYLTEQSRKYKHDIRNAKNWIYEEEDDRFICPNNRRVVFKKYLEKKNASGFVQSYKIYECEDCSDCPLKEMCTKAKGNRQVHWNPVFEELKAKAKIALECEDKKAIYTRRKIEVESVFGNIKGNLWFRRFLLRGLDKVHIEFGLVALAHNFLKWATICQKRSRKYETRRKQAGKNAMFFSACLIFRGLIGQPLSYASFTG